MSVRVSRIDLFAFTVIPPKAHEKHENRGFLTTLDAVGRCVPVKTPAAFQKANKINGVVHISYGAAMICFHQISNSCEPLSKPRFAEEFLVCLNGKLCGASVFHG